MADAAEHSTATIEAIRRYPLKGFRGQGLESARLRVGAGIPFDRHFGIVSGNRPEDPGAGKWVPSRAFVQTTVYENLLKFDCSFDESTQTLSLARPDGTEVQSFSDDETGLKQSSEQIRNWFDHGPHGSVRIVAQSQSAGFWDYPDSAVSIVNLATVRRLEEMAGQALDPRRFRANIHVDTGLPWIEFAWPSLILQCGTAKLRVIRPISRCAATSVDPASGDRDFDMPALLQSRFGHVFCGVYAETVQDGRVAIGDAIQLHQHDASCAPGIQPPNAPERRLWPRRVACSVNHSGNIVLTEAIPASDLFEPPRYRLHDIGDAKTDWVTVEVAEAAVGNGEGTLIAMLPEGEPRSDRVRSIVLSKGTLLVSGPYPKRTGQYR